MRAVLALCILTATSAFAQAPVFAPLTITPKLQPLSWNSSLHSQYANFSVTCGYSAPAMLTIDSYTWSSVGLTLAATTTTSASNSGYCTGAGAFYITVQIKLHYTAFPDEHVTFNGWNDEYCAAFGGPISFGSNFGNVPTWHNDGNTAGNPWYAQYFQPVGYSYGTYDQTPQGTLVGVSSSQPGTTTVTWSIGSMNAGGASITNVPPGTLNLAATAAGTNTIGATFNVSWPDPSSRQSGTAGTQTGSGADDTSSTQDHIGTSWITRSNVIDCHKPGTLTWSATGTGMPYQNPLPAGTTGWETDYQLKLVDSAGTLMQDIWFNENFPNPQPTGDVMPPGYAVNGYPPDFWETQDSGALIGIAAGVDRIYYNWGTLPTPPATWQTYHVQHSYYAATKATDGTHGIKVGTANITLTPGNVNNSPTRAQTGQ